MRISALVIVTVRSQFIVWSVVADLWHSFIFPGTGLCQGDSGGSISFEKNGIYYIRGIVSVGQGKPNPITQKIECDSMQFAVFTDVAKFLPWIIHETTVEREIKHDCLGNMRHKYFAVTKIQKFIDSEKG